MIKTGNFNLNTKNYWDSVYQNEDKRTAYIENETMGNGSQRLNYALKEVKDGDKCLDIGCGVGVFTKMIKQKYPTNEVWGVDISEKVIDANKNSNDGCNYVNKYVGNMQVGDNFDFVFSGEVLEHLDDPNLLFLDAFKALKPGGKFLLTTPVEDKIQSDEHVWYFKHEDIEQLFLNNGFDNIKFIYLPKLEHLLVIMAVGEKRYDL